jgi:hypothetical protein
VGALAEPNATPTGTKRRGRGKGKLASHPRQALGQLERERHCASSPSVRAMSDDVALAPHPCITVAAAAALRSHHQLLRVASEVPRPASQLAVGYWTLTCA